MNPRIGLVAGAAIAAAAGLVLALAPARWLEGLLDVSGADATAFLVRRYGASATVALFVVTAAIARGTAPRRAALLALATWFGGQAVAAIWGLLTGIVAGLAWLAVIVDPLIAAWFLLSARSSDVARAVTTASPDRQTP